MGGGEPQAEEVTEAAMVERPAPVEAAPSPKPEKPGTALYGSARVERIRQLLRDVKLHFQVKDWEHAVSLLYELVELEPESAQHHAMLARAMARHPVMRKDAERHFIEALRLAPQDADLHFSLGLYYKSFGMHSRAQHEFRTAIRINPNHEDAKQHISTGRNAKDPAARRVQEDLRLRRSLKRHLRSSLLSSNPDTRHRSPVPRFAN